MFFVIFCLTLLNANLFSSDWKHVFNAESGRIVKINYVDNRYAYFNCTATRRNKIFKSSDLGKTWENIYDKDGFENTPPLFNFDDFIQVDTNNWFMSYWDKYIHKTTDGGINYETIKIGERDLFEISMYDSNVGIIREEGGNIFITNNSWNTINKLEEFDLLTTEKNFIFQSKTDVYCIAYDRADISRQHLIKININNSDYKYIYEFNFFGEEREYISEFQIVNSMLYFAVGSIKNGIGDQRVDLIFRSKDGGKSWEKIVDQETIPTFGLNRISFYDEMNGIATGNWGKVYMTNDGGESWFMEDPEDMKKNVWHSEESYQGPVNTVIGWLDTVPVLGSFNGHIYRYEGDFFNFNYKRILASNLISPQNQKITDSDVEFSWSDVEDAEIYKLQITEDEEFDNLIFNVETQETKLHLENLKSNQKYYWRVITEKGTQIRESENREFTTTIGTPKDLYPICDSNIITLNPSLTWSKQNGVDEYSIEISEQSDFNNILLSENVNSNTFNLNDLNYGTEYFWRVKVLYNEVETEWSEICNFTTMLEPISKFTPECNSQEQELDLLLEWTNPKSSEYFDLEISDNSLFEDSNYIDSIETNQYIISGLKSNTEYFWHVRAYNYNSATDWSEACNFITKNVGKVTKYDPNIILFKNDLIMFKKQVTYIRIVDILGYTKEYQYDSELNISDLRRGVYFLQFTYKEQNYNYKFIKE